MFIAIHFFNINVLKDLVELFFDFLHCAKKIPRFLGGRLPCARSRSGVSPFRSNLLSSAACGRESHDKSATRDRGGRSRTLSHEREHA